MTTNCRKSKMNIRVFAVQKLYNIRVQNLGDNFPNSYGKPVMFSKKNYALKNLSVKLF